MYGFSDVKLALALGVNHALLAAARFISLFAIRLPCQKHFCLTSSFAKANARPALAPEQICLVKSYLA
jgi:hypothetical protein